MKLIFRWFSVALGFFVAAHYVSGIEITGFGTALFLAAAWGLLGMVVRPILVILTLPVTILTLGLFIFIINAGLFWWLGGVIQGFEVSGFGPALLGSIVLSVVSSVTNWILEKFRHEE
jgi:putative membrane protein